MTKTTTTAPVRVGLISLGCAKNLVDAEIMLGSLMKSGVEIVNDATQADVVIVNTCSFIDGAKEESVEAILESSELREKVNPSQGLIVSGCLTQRFREELPTLLPEVDAFMGIDQVAEVSAIVHLALSHRREKIAGGSVNLLEARFKTRKGKKPATLLTPVNLPPILNVNQRPTYIPDFETPRFRLTPQHFAYVKIAEGCNHPCSFCIIPQMRGSHRSRVQADIVKEAKQLIADGVKELNLISQDSTYYGLDLRANHSRAISSPEKFTAAAKSLPTDATTLCTLLRELNAIPGDFWIRLLYTHPAHWTDELIQTIAECKKVARYVDMPLQHIHQNMLERMRRETSQQYIVDLIAKIRAGVPGFALRTTFIVGFPGETEECFDTLMKFIHETKFERMGIFNYSQEDGTRAGKMEGQLPEKIKKQRQKLAMTAQLQVARDVAEAFVGREIRVLIEREAHVSDLQNAKVSSWEHGLIRHSNEATEKRKGHFMVARGEADAPDIDGRVYVRGHLPAGQFAMVKVIAHTDYDLIAEPA